MDKNESGDVANDLDPTTENLGRVLQSTPPPFTNEVLVEEGNGEEVDIETSKKPSEPLSPKREINPEGSIPGALKAFKENLDEIKSSLSEYIKDPMSVSTEEFPSMALTLGKLCNIDLSSLPQYVQNRTKETVGTVSLATLLDLTQQYLEEDLAARNHIIANRPGLDFFHEFFTESNDSLRNLFAMLTKNTNKVETPEKAKDFIAKAFEASGIRFATTTGMDQREVIESIVEVITKIEGNEFSIEFEALINYISGYVSESEEVVLTLPAPEETEEDKRGKPDKGEDELIRQIKASINQYENLLKLQIQQGKDTTATRDLIALLNHQMAEYLKESNVGRNESLTYPTVGNSQETEEKLFSLEEKMQKGIKEIFYFYCRQQYLLGKKPTFDQMQQITYNMNLGEFMKFCKDFRIPLKPVRIKELFKRRAKLGKELDFDHFLYLLQKVADQIVDDQIAILREKADGQEKTSIRKSSVQTKKDCATNTEENRKEMNQAQQQIENEITFLKNKQQREKLLELYMFLECADKEKYRKKMKGIAMPFRTHEKSFRLPLDEHVRNYHFVPSKPAEEIKREVAYLKKQRIDKKKALEQEEKGRYERNRRILKKIYEQQMKRRIEAMESMRSKQVEREKEPTYKELKNKQMGIPMKAQQVTWQMLKTLTFKDIYGNSPEDNFNPSDLIDDKGEDAEIMRKLEPRKALPAEMSNTQEGEYQAIPIETSSPPKLCAFQEGRRSVPPKKKLLNKSVGRTHAESPLRQSSKYVERERNIKVNDAKTSYPPVYYEPKRSSIRRYMIQSKPFGGKIANISYDTALRAEEVEQEEKRKEVEKYGKLLGLHERQIQKGINIISKR